jgi:hypothetical protein
MDIQDAGCQVKYLIRDRDGKYVFEPARPNGDAKGAVLPRSGALATDPVL